MSYPEWRRMENVRKGGGGSAAIVVGCEDHVFLIPSLTLLLS